MTQEDKDLLLKDLCARLPYEVILLAPNKKITYQTDGNTGAELLVEEEWKPYLRSMSSMTEEEKEEIKPFFSELRGEAGRRVLVVRQNEMPLYQDYLNAHFLDYRGLIPKGLALEAPEGMYKVGRE